MSKSIMFLVAGVLAMGLGGCASTTPEPRSKATHYWESDVSSKQYNADHAACEAKTHVNADGQLDPNSTSFEAYRDCMISEGYSLRTY